MPGTVATARIVLVESGLPRLGLVVKQNQVGENNHSKVGGDSKILMNDL